MKNPITFSTLLAIVLCLVLTTSHARWMIPIAGRFQTMDSFEGNKQAPQTLHKYTYSQANPVNRVDPSGLADFLLFWGDEQGVPFEDAAETKRDEIEKRSSFDSAKDKTYIISVRKSDDVGKALTERKDIKEIYFFVHHSPDVMHLDMVSTASDSNISKDGATYTKRTGLFRKETYLTTAFKTWDKSHCMSEGSLFIFGCHSTSLAKNMGIYLFGKEGTGIGTTCYFPRGDDGGTYPMGRLGYINFLNGQALNLNAASGFGGYGF